MISKVKSVQSTGSFENDFGTVQDNVDLPNHGKKLLYKFEYEFEDGVIMTANHKTNTSPFPTGTEVDYEVTKTHPEYGKSGRVKKPEQSNYSGSNASNGSKGGDAVQLMIVRQSSLNRAVEVCIHNALQSNDEDTFVDEIEVIELAERLTKWVMQTEKKEEPKPQIVDKEAENKKLNEQMQMDEAARAEQPDDLPF